MKRSILSCIASLSLDLLVLIFHHSHSNNASDQSNATKNHHNITLLKLLNFNIEKEDFSAKNTNNLIKTLENIIIARNIEKVNLKIQNIKEIIELKQALKI